MYQNFKSIDHCKLNFEHGNHLAPFSKTEGSQQPLYKFNDNFIVNRNIHLVDSYNIKKFHFNPPTRTKSKLKEKEHLDPF